VNAPDRDFGAYATLADGRRLGNADIRDAALARARHALAYLTAKLGTGSMLQLLADDLNRTASEVHGWMAASAGEWQTDTIQLLIEGLEAQPFQDWYAGIRSGTRNSQPGDPERFRGQVWNNVIGVGEDPARVHVARPTFAPGSRTAWRSHPHGQILAAVHGSGLAQSDGDPAVIISPGDSVSVAPGERHWHGAVPDQVFIQLSGSSATSPRSIPVRLP
jgi:quercetin dioxygenase-like cupin family protein